MEVGGLDEAEVSVLLDNGKIIGIPWDFESEIIEKELRKDSESLFSDLSDIPGYHINPEGKSIQEVLDAKKKRESSFFGRIKKAVGLGEGIPKEHIVHKTEYSENKLKHLKNQKIVDFLIFENYDSVGFIELENGFIITETTMSPSGTGMAGLNYYESLESFEESCGTGYKRIINKSH
ncbi:MAG: hypothetical protein KDC49_17395 [Saprospiraceae bacterium]|nr:hypothetical protein [Saprospiraceae bacterium]